MERIEVRPVILCGGAGTRLWPLSRAGFPKQFLCVTGSESLFQQAARRLADLAAEDIDVARPLIVSHEDHRFLASEQLREVGIESEAILLEPAGRNTAPALAFAALAAAERDDDPVLVVTPADHAIGDEAEFAAALRRAARIAATGSIVILGVPADRPETGYGYIKATPSGFAYRVEQFVEKPDLENAERYIAEGGFFWNAGIFVLRASSWNRALEHFRPDISAAMNAAWKARSTDTSFMRPGRSEFEAIPSESVDYAVMERCPGSPFSIGMVPLEARWSDLGAWDSVWQTLPKDVAGNAVSGDVIATDVRNSFVMATSRLVCLVGVEDMVVIETPDAVMVTDKSSCQAVKAVVERLSADRRDEHLSHRKVHRPWGWYDSVDAGGRFKVKRILVKPKASLSLQKHHHRAEHWVVVSGTAEVVCGDKRIVLTENQSTYIPLGEVHRLSNPGPIPLEIIEVQSGGYLGEDDIIRLDDEYGRSARGAE